MNSHFTRVEERNECRPDGKRRYTETLAFLSPAYQHLYFDTSRASPTGERWIRIGECTKWDEGRIVWQLTYDESGRVKAAWYQAHPEWCWSR